MLRRQEYLPRPHTLLLCFPLSCLCPGCCAPSSSSLFTLPSPSYACMHTGAAPEVRRVLQAQQIQCSLYPLTASTNIVAIHQENHSKRCLLPLMRRIKVRQTKYKVKFPVRSCHRFVSKLFLTIERQKFCIIHTPRLFLCGCVYCFVFSTRHALHWSVSCSKQQSNGFVCHTGSGTVRKC